MTWNILGKNKMELKQEILRMFLKNHRKLKKEKKEIKVSDQIK